MKKSHLISVILAAGKGTRMKSSLPKVLHKIAGKTMIERIYTETKIVSNDIIFVIGSGKVEKHISEYKNCRSVYQRKKLGTADALAKVKKLTGSSSCRLLVVPGDVPMLRSSDLKHLIDFDLSNANDISILSASADNPFGYGRIIKKNGKVIEIREELDASAAEKRIKIINSGIYIFRAPAIYALLAKIKPNPLKKEFYLTDVIKIAAAAGLKIKNLNADGDSLLMGINSQNDLSLAEKEWKKNKEK
ncbi:NTP transferase domain-containing protein [bacterium]|nr:NTP transferase domain-containing protein [bacterium]MBU4133934.1 NTP transferase domain-containing protein [bacterium]